MSTQFDRKDDDKKTGKNTEDTHKVCVFSIEISHRHDFLWQKKADQLYEYQNQRNKVEIDINR